MGISVFKQLQSLSLFLTFPVSLSLYPKLTLSFSFSFLFPSLMCFSSCYLSITLSLSPFLINNLTASATATTTTRTTTMLHTTIAATVCKIVEIARSKEHLMFSEKFSEQNRWSLDAKFFSLWSFFLMADWAMRSINHFEEVLFFKKQFFILENRPVLILMTFRDWVHERVLQISAQNGLPSLKHQKSIKLPIFDVAFWATGSEKFNLRLGPREL